jgi:hypothetical protein
MPGINAGKAWSEEEIDQLKSMVARGFETKQIAVALGRSQGAIETKIDRVRGKRTRPSPVSARGIQRRKTGAAFFLS